MRMKFLLGDDVLEANRHAVLDVGDGDFGVIRKIMAVFNDFDDTPDVVVVSVGIESNLLFCRITNQQGFKVNECSANIR